MATIPFIDIFAGPGGLSEGFSRYAPFSGSSASFQSHLAIEKDDVAVKTLRLRAFFRAFGSDVPAEYYQFLRREITQAELEAHPRWAEAEGHVWKAELGKEPEDHLHERIRTALGDAKDWILLGGPPCQAYSLVGRSRMTGIGAAAREAGLDLDKLRLAKHTKFAADLRHNLYREYLRIVAVHQPAVFVMENVKGILSSRLHEGGDDEGVLVFKKIREDLSDPWRALSGDSEYDLLAGCRKGAPHQYRLYSLVVGGKRTGAKLKDREFLIKSEDYGVPQRRHRVIILGVRDDIRASPRALKRKPSRYVRDAIGALPPIRSAVSRCKLDLDWRGAIRSHVRTLALRSHGDRKIGGIISAFCETGLALDRGHDFLGAELKQGRGKLGEWYADPRLKGVVQHFGRSHMVSDLVRYLYASASAQIYGSSPSLEEWPTALIPNHRNVTIDSESGRLKATGFSDRFKVQVSGHPSSTVTSHIHKDGHYFIHPDPMQCRSLTVREAARLQTFPDNYYFCGNRTEQYMQVGNAVPPYLAYQIAEVVARLMEDAGLTEAPRG